MSEWTEEQVKHWVKYHVPTSVSQMARSRLETLPASRLSELDDSEKLLEELGNLDYRGKALVKISDELALLVVIKRDKIGIG